MYKAVMQDLKSVDKDYLVIVGLTQSTRSLVDFRLIPYSSLLNGYVKIPF